MKKIYHFMVILTLLFVCANIVSGEAGYKEINTLELKKWLESDSTPVIINSLSPIEFGEGYIPGSISIPMELMEVSEAMPEDFKAPIVTYSYGPESDKSKIAATLAVKMGYQDVYWYREGLQGWEKAGYSTQYNLKLPEIPASPKKPAELFKQLQDKEKIILVDIRDENTRKKSGVISGVTIHLPLYRLHNLYGELPKNKLLVVYDSNGKQSSIACRYLFKRHFNNVTWLEGGLEAWAKEKLPVE